MILKLHKSIVESEARELAHSVGAFVISKDGHWHLILSSGIKNVPDIAKAQTEQHWIMESDIQIASKKFSESKPLISFKGAEFAQANETAIIAGPCSVESQEQIFAVSEMLSNCNIHYIRAGCYKPRTSPYSFQGLGLDGLKMLREAADHYGLKVVTEAKDYSHIHSVIQYADVVQIGTKAMYDHSILKACGETDIPVLLKRGFGSTLQEFVQAAEFVLSAGNPNVILCERGIRSFESKTRFTLDLSGVAYLKEHVNLPIVVDPSHAMGYAYGVPDLARAATAMGIDGLLIEVHPNPANALSDASQQLDFDTFVALVESLKRVADSIDYKIV